MSSPMVRKQIYLDKQTDTRLKREAKQRGISQAALIRERLATDPAAINVAVPNPQARDELLAYLRWVRKTAGEGPGTGWRFSREETYAERNEKARTTRHEPVTQRSRPSGAS